MPAAWQGQGQLRSRPGADLRVLFVGNSLTASNDLPGMVAAIAAHEGKETAYATVVRSGYSLEDHWNQGLEDAIRESAADYVVLQQGPSSLPRNQEHLRFWTERIAGAVEASGGRPVLFMVWPSRARTFAAALTLYGTLAAADGATLPCPDLSADLDGARTDDDREIVCEAAGATLATYAR